MHSKRPRSLEGVLKSTECRSSKLSRKGFDIRNRHISVMTQTHTLLKIMVKGIPLSVDDGEIVKMLEQFDLNFASELKYEHIRHQESKKMTTNSFLFKIGKNDTNLCNLCKIEEETIYHLLWQCPIVQDLINSFFNFCNTRGIMEIHVGFKSYIYRKRCLDEKVFFQGL